MKIENETNVFDRVRLNPRNIFSFFDSTSFRAIEKKMEPHSGRIKHADDLAPVLLAQGLKLAYETTDVHGKELFWALHTAYARWRVNAEKIPFDLSSLKDITIAAMLTQVKKRTRINLAQFEEDLIAAFKGIYSAATIADYNQFHQNHISQISGAHDNFRKGIIGPVLAYLEQEKDFGTDSSVIYSNDPVRLTDSIVAKMTQARNGGELTSHDFDIAAKCVSTLERINDITSTGALVRAAKKNMSEGDAIAYLRKAARTIDYGYTLAELTSSTELYPGRTERFLQKYF